ncbi:MAG: helix-turn-helix domain-containing protein [Euryarchaeota archaeon]
MKDPIFVAQLIEFGFTKGEAELYYHLIKHGPKTIAALSRNLNTYREHVYRTLVSLQTRGAIDSKLNEHGIYLAVPLERVLDTELRRHQLEHQEKEELIPKILEAKESLSLEPLGTSCRFQLHHTLNEIGASCLRMVDSANHLVLVIMPPALSHSTMLAVQTAVINAAKRGLDVRGITDSIECSNTQVKDLKICSYGTYDGICFLVVDSTETMTFIHWEGGGKLRNKMASAFYCDDPAYAQHLEFVFDMVWNQLADTKTAKKLQTV